MKKLKKLPKKQRGGGGFPRIIRKFPGRHWIPPNSPRNDSTPEDTTTGQISQTRDATNNDIMKYFNDLEASRNRRDPGMQGDRKKKI